MRRKTTIIKITITGVIILLLLGNCDVSSIWGGTEKELGSNPTRSPDPCGDVSRFEEIATELNPEEENCVARSINIIKFKGKLYAMYLNASTEISCSQIFLVYVSVHGCDGTWTRTNQGNELNVIERSIQYAANCHVRLIEYKNSLYAVWQEHYGLGPVIHVKRYNESTDVWERVDGDSDMGLTNWYLDNPNIDHWSYFHYAGAPVSNNALYITWRHANNGIPEMAIMKGVLQDD